MGDTWRNIDHNFVLYFHPLYGGVNVPFMGDKSKVPKGSPYWVGLTDANHFIPILFLCVYLYCLDLV